MEYIAFMHDNTDSPPTKEDWDSFFELANHSGLFRGGSAIGNRSAVGEKDVPDVTAGIVGFMRFDAETRQSLTELLKKHPTIVHGGTVEICEMPST